MTVKARWHQEIVLPDDDPFRQRVEEVGYAITLTEDTPRLELELVELIRVESGLHSSGVTCAIKDRPDTSCMACPLSAHEDPKAALQPLCTVGRKEESVMTRLAIVREAARSADS